MPDPVKLSRMELRLEAEIAAAPHTLEADCKRAELAAYRARLGRLDTARAELGVLRQKYERYPRVEPTAWINLAEGLTAYFRSGGVSKTDGVQRAYALSVAANLRRLQVICAAWLAQLDYAKLDIDSLVVHACEALRLADPEHHSARSRATLVIAQALHMAGRLDLAKVWYIRSKNHATSDCDDATMSALMHNMAWLRMLSLRQVVLSGIGDPNIGRHAIMNAQSNANFDSIIGDSSWQFLKPILRAQIASLQGDAVLALALYDEHLDGSKSPERWQSNLFADKAWCQAMVGNFAESQKTVERAEYSLSAETQIDDLAATHSRLAQALKKLTLMRESQKHEVLAAKNWKEFSNIQIRAVQLLGSIDENGLPFIK